MKLSSGTEKPVTTCQLGAWHSPIRAGNVRNPSAFTEKGKQADHQTTGWLTDTGQTGGGREVEWGAHEMR